MKWDGVKCLTGNLGEEKDNEAKKIFQEMIVKSFLGLIKHISSQFKKLNEWQVE